MPTAKGTDPRQTVQKIPLNLSELIESWGDIKHGILGKRFSGVSYQRLKFNMPHVFSC